MKTYATAELVVSSGPYIHAEDTNTRIVWTVIAALIPSACMAILYFGLPALSTIALCIVSCITFEYIGQKLRKKNAGITDGTAVLTGLLLAFNLPPGAPVFISIIGCFVAIVITKQLFGGTGHNIFNPALMGRAFLLLSFPRAMSAWSSPHSLIFSDAISSATPLSVLKSQGPLALEQAFQGKSALYLHLLVGQRGGCIGETTIIAILIGGLFLLYKKYISWHIPVSYLLTAGLFAWIFGGTAGLCSGDALMHILSGGIVLGAFFMATDYVTSPSSPKGKIVFGIGCGIITMLIRLKGTYPEGVMFSILIMNCFSSLLDNLFSRPIFGTKPARIQS